MPGRRELQSWQGIIDDHSSGWIKSKNTKREVGNKVFPFRSWRQQLKIWNHAAHAIWSGLRKQMSRNYRQLEKKVREYLCIGPKSEARVVLPFLLAPWECVGTADFHIVFVYPWFEAWHGTCLMDFPRNWWTFWSIEFNSLIKREIHVEAIWELAGDNHKFEMKFQFVPLGSGERNLKQSSHLSETHCGFFPSKPRSDFWCYSPRITVVEPKDEIQPNDHVSFRESVE